MSEDGHNYFFYFPEIPWHKEEADGEEGTTTRDGVVIDAEDETEPEEGGESSGRGNGEETG